MYPGMVYNANRYTSTLYIILSFTNWGQHKMVDIFQTTISDAFSWKKMSELRLDLHFRLHGHRPIPLFMIICQEYYKLLILNIGGWKRDKIFLAFGLFLWRCLYILFDSECIRLLHNNYMKIKIAYEYSVLSLSPVWNILSEQLGSVIRGVRVLNALSNENHRHAAFHLKQVILRAIHLYAWSMLGPIIESRSGYWHLLCSHPC